MKRFVTLMLSALLCMNPSMLVHAEEAEEETSVNTEEAPADAPEDSGELEEIIDTKAPELKDIKFTPDTVDASVKGPKGQDASVNITITASDDISGLSDGYVVLTYEDENNFDILTAYVFADSETTLSGNLYVKEYQKNGTYKLVSLYINDNADNTATFTAGDKDHPLPEKFAALTVTVTGGKKDEKAPVLNDFKVNSATVEPGKAVDITMDVTDEESGIDQNEIVAIFHNKKTDKYITTYFGYDEKTKKFKSDTEIEKGTNSGEYVLSYFLIYDMAGNLLHEVPEKFKDAKFTVTGSQEDTEGPEFVSGLFGSYVASVPSMTEIFVTGKDEGSGVKDAELLFSDKKGENLKSAHLVNYYFDDEKQEIVEYPDGLMHGYLQLDSYYPESELFVYAVSWKIRPATMRPILTRICTRMPQIRCRIFRKNSASSPSRSQTKAMERSTFRMTPH